MLNILLGLFSHDLAIDLGTANTLVYVRGKGILIRQPSVVARHKKERTIIAIGQEAKQMIGKTPTTLSAFRPLKDGVIADFDATEAMLAFYIRRVHEMLGSTLWQVAKPRVVIGIPSGVTEVERRAVQDALLIAGARQAFLIEEPMAAAIGAKLPINQSRGVMIVDIGGGTTEIAVIALGGIVVNRSIRIGGDEMDEAIASFLRLKYSLLVGMQTAEQIKIDIGSAHPGIARSTGKKVKASASLKVSSFALKDSARQDKSLGKQPNVAESSKGQGKAKAVRTHARHTVVRGRDLETGLPKTVRLTQTEIREALSPVVTQIIAAISEVVEETPPELVPDILEHGLALTGGGALLANIDQAIAEVTRLPVWIVDDPLTSVVRGCGQLLDDSQLLKKLRVTGGLKS